MNLDESIEFVVTGECQITKSNVFKKLDELAMQETYGMVKYN